MPVVGIAKEIVEAREKNAKASGERTYRRRFLVTVTDQYDDSNVALSAPGLPQRYFPYITSTSIDLQARCVAVTASQVPGSYTHWHIECDYDTEHKDEEEENENPLLEPPDINFSFETIQVPITGTPDQTITPTTGGKWTGAIKTSAGEIFDPPPMMDESRPVVTITRNESRYSASRAVAYQNAVNSDSFFGSPARSAKIRSISADLQTKKGVTYWKVTYVIVFKRDLWDLQILDYGSYYLSGTTKILFGSTDGVRRLDFLNGSGGVGSSTAPTFLQFRIHKELPFASLNLPIDPNR